MKIVHIQAPYVITDNGDRIDIDTIDGHPKIGAELIDSAESSMWKIGAITSDSECVGGVCPIK